MSFVKTNATTLTAEEDLYLAADGETVVRAGDYRAATLLARAGSDIPPKHVTRLNLGDGSSVESLKAEGPKPEQVAAAKVAYDKQVATANVALRAGDNAKALAAYEAAVKNENLEPAHRADATAQVKALKAQVEAEKANPAHALGKPRSSEDISSRSTTRVEHHDKR